jgi:hypothetical protein
MVGILVQNLTFKGNLYGINSYPGLISPAQNFPSNNSIKQKFPLLGQEFLLG